MRRRNGRRRYGLSLALLLGSTAAGSAQAPGYPGWAPGWGPAYPPAGYLPVATYPPPSFADLQPGTPLMSLPSLQEEAEEAPASSVPVLTDTGEMTGVLPEMSRSVTAADEASALSDQPAPEPHPVFAPHMIGQFRGLQGVTIVPVATAGGGVTFARLEQPLVGRGAFKIAENESPQPRDRVFITYNYYNHMPTTARDGLYLPGDGSTINVPGRLIHTDEIDVHQQVFGFEKTLGDGRLSVGMRVPIFQAAGGDIDPISANNGFTAGLGDGIDSDIGDLTAIFKWAMFGDKFTGSLVTSGLAVTVPTGPRFFVVNPHLPISALLQPTANPTLVLTQGDNTDSVLIQPYLGVLLNGCKYYFQGFSSLVVPTDAPDVTMMFNDFGVGWYMYKAADDNLVNFITPTFEVHVDTPLSNRGGGAEIFVPDIVTLTNGIHVGIGGGALFSAAIAVPITGPQPYDVGAIFQFNLVF